MRRGRYGNPLRPKLRLTLHQGRYSSRPAAGSGQKKVICGPLGVLVHHQPPHIKHCQGDNCPGNADGGQMREIALGLALLLGACASSAAEGQTLCSSAVSAFDGKDLPATQEFLRVAQNVFDELDAQSMEKGEPALKTKLTDKSVEGFIILGHCRQHPTDNLRSGRESVPAIAVPASLGQYSCRGARAETAAQRGPAAHSTVAGVG
jgi:hypothetical protein